MKRNYILLGLLLLQMSSCKKWLDVKSNIADVTPTTLEDYQALADNDRTNNGGSSGLALVSSDNYYVTYTTWQARSAVERNSYVWASELYEGSSPAEWSKPFAVVNNANIILEGIAAIPVTPANTSAWNNTRGSALFMRALSFFNLAQTFSPHYNKASANTDKGIPLRLKADANDISVRASVEETYQQILTDLKEAADLLPVSPAYQTRPGKAAAYGLLAKTYLIMGDYAQSFTFSDKAIAVYNTLIDFNTLNAAATNPFPAYPGNKEIIYYISSSTYLIFQNANPITDSVLYQSYAANDLRKTIFYKLNNNLPQFRANYLGAVNGFFSGIASNELYLIRAESNARLGNTGAALTDLNTLLLKRWKTGTFVSFTAATPAEALTKILTERRKELPFTGSTRWEDLRRLNTDPLFAKTLTRQLNGVTYTLPPNDRRYTLPIPDEEIKLSGITQNPR